MHAHIQLGSNVGDRLSYLSVAQTHIEHTVGTIIKASSIYESAPWGNEDQSYFLNQIIELRTAYSPEQLLNQLLNIEDKMGRVRTIRWAPRIIDLDIIYYESNVIDSAKLVIPHPEISTRRFTLVPLVECWPDLIHPILEKSNHELLKLCDDTNTVSAYLDS